MKDELDLFIEKINKITKEEKVKEKDKKINEALTKIQFFQHERLVHLIVTFFVGISCILFLCFALLVENIGLFILFLLTFILFVFYIFHYYHLENGVQYLYKKYFELLEKEKE